MAPFAVPPPVKERGDVIIYLFFALKSLRKKQACEHRGGRCARQLQQHTSLAAAHCTDLEVRGWESHCDDFVVDVREVEVVLFVLEPALFLGNEIAEARLHANNLQRAECRVPGSSSSSIGRSGHASVKDRLYTHGPPTTKQKAERGVLRYGRIE